MSVTLSKVIDGKPIRAREPDRYVNATELAKAAGKKWNDYSRLDGTKQFLEALKGSAGIPADVPLVQITNSAPNESRGTWIHPRVVIHFAQWASAEFAAVVTSRVGSGGRNGNSRFGTRACVTWCQEWLEFE